MNLQIPKKLDFGGGEVVELAYLEQILEIKRRTAAKYLRALRIKPMYMGGKIYFSLPTFKRIMFVLSLPGSPGFLFPGSAGKNNPRLLKDDTYISEVTDKILERAADPRILAEMMGCEGRNPAILKQFITKPVGRPSKKDKDE